MRAGAAVDKLGAEAEDGDGGVADARGDLDVGAGGLAEDAVEHRGPARRERALSDPDVGVAFLGIEPAEREVLGAEAADHGRTGQEARVEVAGVGLR
jgi:hypothetical protein